MKKAICVFVFCVLCIPFLGWVGARVYLEVIFVREVEGHLKRAADANTVEIATKELERATTYLAREGMMKGYTSILYRTPDEDVEFWYGNLSASLVELKQVKLEVTKLERTNVLMKLRETLLDTDSNGKTVVTSPDGISVFPHNGVYAFWGIAGLVVGLVGFIVMVGLWDDY